MAVKIRLARHGAKKRTFYRIVVAQSEAPRDGRFLEIVGTYNPLTEPATILVEGERIKHWIANGAVPSATVHSLLKKAGVYKEAAAE